MNNERKLLRACLTDEELIEDIEEATFTSESLTEEQLVLEGLYLLRENGYI